MTRRLILIRHAKSDYPFGVHDHDRPLNDRGRRDAPEIGHWLDRNVTWADGEPPLVLVSTAHRAQSTWDLASRALSARWGTREERAEPRIYEASTTALISIIDECPESVTTLVMVGHNPGLASLIDRMCEEDTLRLAATEKFPTSAIAVLETSHSWSAATSLSEAFRVTSFAVPRSSNPPG